MKPIIKKKKGDRKITYPFNDIYFDRYLAKGYTELSDYIYPYTPKPEQQKVIDDILSRHNNDRRKIECINCYFDMLQEYGSDADYVEVVKEGDPDYEEIVKVDEYYYELKSNLKEGEKK